MAGPRSRSLAILVWLALAGVTLGPIALAAASPYLAYRNPAYIIGGFAGIICLALMLVQPLLAAGYLPGIGSLRGRGWHRWLGYALLLGAVLHVGELFVTSPPDTLDALLLVAPTSFSVYGVIAFWCLVATALLVAVRRRIRPVLWWHLHNGLALILALATVIHALQIDGAMELFSKAVLCIAVLVASWVALFDLRVRRPLRLWRSRRMRRETRGAGPP